MPIIQLKLFIRYFLVLFLFFRCTNPLSVENYHTNPNDVQIVSNDVFNFWKAFDSSSARPLPDAQQIFQKYYFDHSSIGLKDYCQINQMNESNLCPVVFTNYPLFYKSIRSRTEEIASTVSDSALLPYFKIFDKTVLNARFADIYFILGNFRSGGKTSSNGIIISLEFFAKTQSTNISELPISFQEVVSSFDESDVLINIIIHELVHINQTKFNQESLLLNQCIIEGLADFVTFLVTGKLLNSLAHNYGNSNELQLWNDFKMDMNNKYTGNNKWIYNFNNYPVGKAPDLGYFIGFKICESYYNNSTDKKDAIRTMLNISDYKQFLIDSKYDPLVKYYSPVYTRVHL